MVIRIRMKDWLTGRLLNCVFSPDLVQKVGPEKTWQETWEHTRFVVSGEITYKKDGSISHVFADDLTNVTVAKIRFEDIADPLFTGGLGVVEYLTLLREQDDG